jgi:L-fucose isomerase-like protein
LGALASPYLEAMAPLGGRRAVTPPGPEGPPCLFLVATGGSERALLDLWAGRGPLFLLAHPGHNSLPAALEALAAVRNRGGRGRIVYWDQPGDPAGRAAVAEAVQDLETAAALRRLRLGLIGPPSDWLVASHPDPAAVRRVWGPEVVAVGMDRFLAACRAAALEGAPGSGVEAALRALVREERLDAVTVRCFDLIGALEDTACPALSALNDEGIVAGCEGDVPSALGMAWVRLLLGSASWMANPARLNPVSRTLVLAHCTVPRTLVGEVRMDTHFESGKGRALAGEFPPGPVTLLRVGGDGLDRLWMAEGDITGAGCDPNLCRTQATVRLAPGVVEGLLRAPLGNHLVAVPGHHGARLRSWWETFVEAGT